MADSKHSNCEFVAAHPDTLIEKRLFHLDPSFVQGELATSALPDSSPVRDRDGPAEPGIRPPGSKGAPADLPSKTKGDLSTLGESSMTAGDGPTLQKVAILPDALANLVGILYYDRLRYQFAGVVRGEHLTTVSLAPGEELVLTQRSETRLDERTEQDFERELTTDRGFSSTWSTEVTQAISSRVAMNMGGNYGAQLSPFDSIPFGLSTGTNGSLDYSSSVDKEVSGALQLSQEVGRQLRMAHKTVFATSRSRTSEDGLERRLKNENRDRSVNYRFHKLFNKQRISLERYDARLALNLLVTSPFASILSEIEQRLDSIDPDATESFDLTPPEGFQTEVDPELREIVWGTPTPPGAPGTFIQGIESYSLVTPPTGYFLSDVKLRVVDEYWMERVNNNPATGTTLEKHEPAEFWSQGGKVRTLLATAKDAPGTPGTKEIGFLALRPLVDHLASPFVPKAAWAKRISVEVSYVYGLEGSGEADFQNQIDEERMRRSAALTPDLVRQIVQQAVGRMRTSAFDGAMGELLQKLSVPVGVESLSFVHDRLRGFFDWNEALTEPLGTWMSSPWREEYERLVARIENLAPGIGARALLPDRLAAQSLRVVLPIQVGQEANVLSRLSQGEWAYADFLEGFRSFREEQFPVRKQLDQLEPAEEVPTPPRVTPDGASEWEAGWEAPGRRCRVLGTWSDTIPTDGTHMECVVGECSAMDDLAKEDHAVDRAANSALARRLADGEA